MKTPCEILLGSNNFVVLFRVFGYIYFVRDHISTVSKLNPQVVKCIFVDYSLRQKGYKCWCPTEQRLFVSMDVTFRGSETFYEKILELDSIFRMALLLLVKRGRM
jgi:hypothetical protein